MTILFSDIRGYTTLSEKMSPEENFKFINRYLQKIGPVIEHHNGFINYFMGDGIMALFTNSIEALNASIELQKKVRELNIELAKEGKPTIKTGIGLHAGNLMLGILGDRNRNDTGVISDAVNTASRVEGLTKLFGASILISGDMLDNIAVKDSLGLRYLGKIQVKGRKRVVKVYECFEGDEPIENKLKFNSAEIFSEGLNCYYAGKFIKAAAKFKNILNDNSLDQAASFYLEQSAKYIVDSPPDNWTGIIKIDKK